MKINIKTYTQEAKKQKNWGKWIPTYTEEANRKK